MNDVAVRQPISHSGQLISLIVAQRASRAESLGGEADAALEEVACEVGVALDKAHLDSLLQASFEPPRIPAAELQASRGRLVAAADAERRRIERNLTLAPGVADDGGGFDTLVRGGAGLTNMRDRLGAVGDATSGVGGGAGDAGSWRRSAGRALTAIASAEHGGAGTVRCSL